MNKILLITLTLLLTSCYNQKPESEPGVVYKQGAIITKDGSIIFYHDMKEIWNEAMEMLY